MKSNIILNNKKFRVSSSDLPSLVHGKQGSGASLFTVTIATQLQQQGNKTIFLSALIFDKNQTVANYKSVLFTSLTHYPSFAIKEFQVVAKHKKDVIDIDWLKAHDLPEVMHIDQLTSSDPWTEEEFRARLGGYGGCCGRVGKRNEKVVGFTVYELHNDGLHLLKLAIHPEQQRTGVGQQLVADRIRSVRIGKKRRWITILLRETNLRAQLFLREQRFKAIKVWRRFFEDSDEDAFLFKYGLKSRLPPT